MINQNQPKKKIQKSNNLSRNYQVLFEYVFLFFAYIVLQLIIFRSGEKKQLEKMKKNTSSIEEAIQSIQKEIERIGGDKIQVQKSKGSLMLHFLLHHINWFGVHF